MTRLTRAPCRGRSSPSPARRSGIGAATARAFADRGAAVVVNSARSVGGRGGGRRRCPTPSTSRATSPSRTVPERLVAAALERWGRLDTLVNNAGTTAVIPHHDLEAASVDVWRRIFEVNVFGTWAMTVAALPALREANGSVVNVVVGGGRAPDGLLHPVRGQQGGAQPPDRAAGQGGRARGAGQRRRSRPDRHAVDGRLGRSCAERGQPGGPAQAVGPAARMWPRSSWPWPAPPT